MSETQGFWKKKRFLWKDGLEVGRALGRDSPSGGSLTENEKFPEGQSGSSEEGPGPEVHLSSVSQIARCVTFCLKREKNSTY